MTLPRLHVVTDDALLGSADFLARASALLQAGGARVALHLRGRALAVRALHELAVPLAAEALRNGSPFLVNDRVDVALAARAGAHLGSRSIPVAEARRLLDRALLGFSAHSTEEARVAEAEGADYVFLGTIYPSASHPGGPVGGLPLLERTVGGATVPVLGIGGITVVRARAVRAAGAHGVAVIRGIWDAADPVRALGEYLEALES